MAILRDEFDESGEELCWKLWIRGIHTFGVVIVLVISFSLLVAWSWSVVIKCI